MMMAMLLVSSAFVLVGRDVAPIDATLGLYVGDGAHPECTRWAQQMFESMGLTIRDIEAADINAGDLDGIDIFYFAGGESGPYIRDISSVGRSRLRQPVRDGAAFIGTCAGSMYAAATQVWEGHRMTQGQLGVFAGDAVGPAPNVCGPNGGVCVCAIDLRPEHPITEGLPRSIELYSYNSPTFRWDPSEPVEIVATYAATGQPTVIAAAYGAGRVLLTGVHPEWTSGDPWDLMTEAARWCLQGSETSD